MEEQHEQKEGLINKMEYETKVAEGLLSDPLLVNSFLKLYDLMVGKAIRQLENAATAKVNDVYMYDKDTYHQSKVDLKTVSSGSVNTVAKHIKDGSEQASTIAIDVQGHTDRWSVIKGIRLGLAKRNVKRILLNWKGQWYQLVREQVYSDYLEKVVK